MKVTNDGSSDSFVIPCLSTALGWVERYCLLELLRRRRWLGLDDFRTDLYVIGHFALHNWGQANGGFSRAVIRIGAIQLF